MATEFRTQISAYSPKWSRTGLLALLVGTFAVIFGVAIGRDTQKLPYLLALVAIPLALKYPVEVALGSVALALPFEAMFVAVQSGSGSTSLMWFVSAGAVVLLFARIVTGLREAPTRVVLVWTLLVAWETTSIVWASDTSVALKRLPMAWSLLIFYVVATSSRITRKQVTVVMRGFVLGGCVAAAWAGWLYLNGNSFLGGGRASLIVGDTEMDPNYFAAMLLIPFSFSVGLFLWSRTRLLKMSMAAAAALVGTTIFLSMSRGALLALFVMLALYGYRIRVRFRTVAVFAVLLAVVALAAPSSLWKRLQPDALRTGAGRTDIWIAGSQMVKHHLLFGVGMANFPVAYNAYAGYAPTFEGFSRDSHNTALKILSEEGLIGLAVFVLGLYYQFRDLERTQRSGRNLPTLVVCLQATLLALLVAAMFIDFLWTKVFWFTLIMCTVIARVESTEAGQPEKAGRTVSMAEVVPRDAMFTRS